jgi:L-ascorbate metabolism protein UlaG (beta-lactamase superfamily)/predicted nuclease of predicted toxin-antitoxin system
MRILLDESLPHKLRLELHGHEIKTVAWMGWSGIKNGQLLNLASREFDVFITADQNLEYQQNLNTLPVAVIVLMVQDIRIQTLRPLISDILFCLKGIRPKTLVHIPKRLLEAKLKNDDFLSDIREALKDDSRLHVWWLGQSGFLLQYKGKHLLLDPYLSDSLTKKYENTDKPHVRMTECVIAPEKLDFIDVVTSSHNHTDHLDAETLIPLMQVNPELKTVVPKANLEFAANRLQVSTERLTPITKNEAVRLEPFTLYAVPAAHENLETDEDGNHKFIGLIIEVGGYTIYHSGDTLLYDGMTDILKRWKIDVALLPINGREPSRGVAGNLSGEEAARLAKDIGAKLVVPCHYDLFEFNTVSPDSFVETAKRIGQPYCVLQNGERLSL